MNTEITRLHGTTSADLLAIPVIMLGFHPRESCVVLGVRGTRVEFCARMDLDWFTNDFRFGQVADQLANAVERCSGCHVAILAYTADPEAGALAVEELTAVVGEDIVLEALVTNGDLFWHVHPAGLVPPGGVPHSYGSSNFAAQAVYSGVNVDASREAAVLAVQPPHPSSSAALAATVQGVAKQLAGLRPVDRMVLLSRHMGDGDQSGNDPTELALLLQEEELFGEVLAQLSTRTAQRLRPRLAAARRISDDALAPNVLALLTLACWLDGEGAQQSDCLAQLESLDPWHPLMRILAKMHRSAAPPGAWDG